MHLIGGDRQTGKTTKMIDWVVKDIDERVIVTQPRHRILDHGFDHVMVQARVSSGPVVKKLMRPSR